MPWIINQNKTRASDARSRAGGLTVPCSELRVAEAFQAREREGVRYEEPCADDGIPKNRAGVQNVKPVAGRIYRGGRYTKNRAGVRNVKPFAEGIYRGGVGYKIVWHEAVDRRNARVSKKKKAICRNTDPCYRASTNPPEPAQPPVELLEAPDEAPLAGVRR
ncbi:hypothetical protein B0H19DRAFT_1066361 [Mycena capillaripes]|nr:hypothetical protein B0H19DRAFT_1066361 [Mycena capillaripes]